MSTPDFENDVGPSATKPVDLSATLKQLDDEVAALTAKVQQEMTDAVEEAKAKAGQELKQIFSGIAG